VLVPPDLISLTLQQARLLSPRVLHLTLARSDGLPQTFIPGQFFRAQIPSPAGPQWRSYSIANATLPGRMDHAQIEMRRSNGWSLCWRAGSAAVICRN